jgi:hypothetical protein
VTGGGINSPRHQTSGWLTATEKGSVGWTDARFSRASVHPVPLPRHITVEILWHNCSDVIHRRCVGSSGAKDPAAKSSLLASTRPSDRPTLHLDQGVESSGAEGFVLARLCLDSNWASDRPTVSPLRPSDHPVLLSFLLFLCNSSDTSRNWTVTVPRVSTSVPTRLMIAPTLAIWVPSVHPTVSFSFFFLRVFNLDLCFNLTYLTCHYL